MAVGCSPGCPGHAEHDEYWPVMVNVGADKGKRPRKSR